MTSCEEVFPGVGLIGRKVRSGETKMAEVKSKCRPGGGGGGRGGVPPVCWEKRASPS